MHGAIAGNIHRVTGRCVAHVESVYGNLVILHLTICGGTSGTLHTSGSQTEACVAGSRYCITGNIDLQIVHSCIDRLGTEHSLTRPEDAITIKIYLGIHKGVAVGRYGYIVGLASKQLGTIHEHHAIFIIGAQANG